MSVVNVLARENLDLEQVPDVSEIVLRRLDQIRPGVRDPIVLVLEPGDQPDLDGVDVPVQIISVGSEFEGSELFASLDENASEKAILRAVSSAARLLALQKSLNERTAEIEDVNEVGMALSTERDHDALLSMILEKTREVTRSDAGSLYLLDEDERGEKVLRWKVAQNASLEVNFSEQELPVTRKSVAGYVAETGETLVIEDVYDISEGVDYGFNRSFDSATGYRTKSMLVVPMMNQKDEIIGVLQLINRKVKDAPDEPLSESNIDLVSGFDRQTTSVARSLAGQAAVAVENNILYASIERLFEGFVTAAVTAIEQRDPTTSGHSFRVADLTVELAQTADRVDGEAFRDISFTSEQIREIRYASLLHDFGKVGVREKVLVKEKKLYPLHLDLIRSRFDFLAKQTEALSLRRALERLRGEGESALEEVLEHTEREMQKQLEEIRELYEKVARSNEPTVLPEGDFKTLQQIAEREYLDYEGRNRRLLKPEEVSALSIRKGSLNEEERKEIESHVSHTFDFLSKIPWTSDLQNVPEYAFGHHEKINGRGYPRGLTGDEIPVQSRMMTIADIFDALTAKDRPYKKAVPVERALDILNMEVEDGLLDPDLVRLFMDAKVYEKARVSR